MTDATRQRLFGIDSAFSHPATGILLAAIGVMHNEDGPERPRQDGPSHQRHEHQPANIALPQLLLPLRNQMAHNHQDRDQADQQALLSIFCYREYARATGLFREKLISFLVIVGILAVQFAVLDNWYLLFVALFPLG